MDRFNLNHPLNDAEFLDWCRDTLDDAALAHLCYGLYDSGWWAVYQDYKDDIAVGEWEK